jgi:hypothetical protein
VLIKKPVNEKVLTVKRVFSRNSLKQCVFVPALIRELEGEKPSGRCRRKWKDNIKMGIHETGCESEDRKQLEHVRV